jgi:hypothetical protein
MRVKDTSELRVLVVASVLLDATRRIDSICVRADSTSDIIPVETTKKHADEMIGRCFDDNTASVVDISTAAAVFFRSSNTKAL